MAHQSKASLTEMSVIASRDAVEVNKYYRSELREAIRLVKESDEQAQRTKRRRRRRGLASAGARDVPSTS